MTRWNLTPRWHRPAYAAQRLGRRLAAWAISLAICALTAGPAAAEDETEESAVAAETTATQPADASAADWRQIAPGLTFDGSFRMRFESQRGVKFDGAATGNDESFSLSRLRMSLTWTPNDRATAFVEVQDARIMGEDVIDETAVPNIFADQLDLHQAYFELGFGRDRRVPAQVRFGRQKLNLGAQRLVASLEWANTARVWDGLRVGLGDEQRRHLDLFVTQLVPVDPGGWNDHTRTRSRMFNSDFHGVYLTDKATIPRTQAEVYWLLRRETAAGDNVHTVGTRLAYRGGVWDADAELAWQDGTYGDRDHRAAMAHAGAGYTASGARGWRLGVAYNFGSGDRNASDDRHETFDNLFPLNHAYYGHMDFFALQNLHNAEVVYTTPLSKQTGLRLAYQWFALVEEESDAWYNAGGQVVRQATTRVSPEVGTEIDVMVSTTIGRIGVTGGVSRFFARAYVRETGSPLATANFYFLQAALRF